MPAQNGRSTYVISLSTFLWSTLRESGGSHCTAPTLNAWIYDAGFISASRVPLLPAMHRHRDTATTTGVATRKIGEAIPVLPLADDGVRLSRNQLEPLVQTWQRGGAARILVAGPGRTGHTAACMAPTVVKACPCDEQKIRGQFVSKGGSGSRQSQRPTAGMSSDELLS
ncbi:unnamed protein product [Phytophthora fragariaefolia]|uniref:Unnamed protein product n=1 Tax=Phytophthora fragariaefolia TaxID=1490495 RepID=A0A9W6YFC7_9STRA|nr:unnamed protein product [Phytophthora fragariaefolia]